MTFRARLDGNLVWSLEYDEASWNELREKCDRLTVNLVLPCCETVPALHRNEHGTFWFAHRPNAPCDQVERRGDAPDEDDEPAAGRGGARGALGELPNLIQWAAERHGWQARLRAPSRGQMPQDIEVDRDGKSALILLQANPPAAANQHLLDIVAELASGKPALWVLGPTVEPIAEIAHSCRRLTGPVARVRSAEFPALKESVRAFVAGFLDGVAAGSAPPGWKDATPPHAAAPELAAPEPHGPFRFDPSRPRRKLAEPEPRPARDPTDPEEVFSYLHIPGHPPILTLKERRRFWGRALRACEAAPARPSWRVFQ